MTRAVVVTALSLLVVAAFVPSAFAVPPPKDRYIVVLEDGVRDPGAVAREHGRRHGAEPALVYGAALKGYAGRIPPGRLGALRRDPRVKYVEADGVAHAVDTQTSATWGLDRIDQRSLPLNGTYTYATTGSGVTAYVIDSGIRVAHSDFGGRAAHGVDYVSRSTGGEDCDGHGTHVAGTIGGTLYGVAKQVQLRSVRVLDCTGSGYWSWVIAGIDWVTANAQRPAVANMSLAGGATTSVDDAVKRSIDSGVTYAVAASNDGRDACRYSPARVPEALTIGATDRTDTRVSWSNWGSCVDWFAPGVGITSAYHTSNTATATMSGTSMASPHTAGAAALYLQTNTTASPAQVRTYIWNALTKGIVLSSKSTYNHLLFVGSPGSTTNAPPTASFSHSCSGLTCEFTSTSTDDVRIVSYAWSFGDGGGSTAQNPRRTYAAGGSYTVTLTVTDDSGATGSTNKSVTVSAPSTGTFALSTRGYKVKGVQHAELTWSGGTAAIDVYRNGTPIATADGGTYTDNIGAKGGGSYTYKVCHAGTTTCSNQSTVVF